MNFQNELIIKLNKTTGQGKAPDRLYTPLRLGKVDFIFTDFITFNFLVIKMTNFFQFK